MRYRVTEKGAADAIAWPAPAIVEEIYRRQDAGLPRIPFEDRGPMIRPMAGDVVDVPSRSVEPLLARGRIERVPSTSATRKPTSRTRADGESR